MPDKNENPVFLTTEQLSKRWNGKPAPRTLERWRSEKKGPPFVKMGGVKYRLTDIIEYENGLKTA